MRFISGVFRQSGSNTGRIPRRSGCLPSERESTNAGGAGGRGNGNGGSRGGRKIKKNPGRIFRKFFLKNFQRKQLHENYSGEIV
jgi:hypothetical protein